jgi:prophage tail gpP-like protein
VTRASLSEDFAELECDSTRIDAWTSYSAASDLFTPADSCRLSIGVGTGDARGLKATIAKVKALMPPGKEAKLWVTAGGKRALQGVYVIDSHEIENDADGGTQFSVSLRDRAAYLIGSAADPKLYESGDTLVKVARRAVAPWPSIEVTADHVAARDLRQARVTRDKLRRLQNKARAWGIPPRLMSEKIAASIDKGTITFEDFAGAQAGAVSRSLQGGVDTTGAYSRPVVESVVSPLLAPATVPLLAGYTGIPYSGATGLSSLAIYQLRVKDVRPQSGETVWEFLDRSAKRNGLLMSVTPDGKLLFCGLHYDQEPSYRITRRIEGDRSQNNVVSGGYRLDISDVASEVVVYGRVKGDDKSRSPFKGHAASVVSDSAHVPYVKTLIIVDNSIKSKDDAQHRAEYELGKSKQGCEVLEYAMRGHSESGLLYAPDTIAHVEDEATGVSGPYYVVARTLTRSAKQGPMTSLKLVPKGSIVLSAVGDLVE